MHDYVVYHKAEKMGYPALDVNCLTIYTNKPTGGTENGRVWLIAGEGKPRRYSLRATFLIGSVEASNNTDFTSQVTGTDGQLLDPMPLLDMEPWFPEFFKAQGHFAFGFNRITNPNVVDALKRILVAHTLRAG